MRASPAGSLVISGPGTSTRQTGTSPRARSSSRITSLSCFSAGTSLLEVLDRLPDQCPRVAVTRRSLLAQILLRSSSFLPITMRWISEVPSPIRSSGASR